MKQNETSESEHICSSFKRINITERKEEREREREKGRQKIVNDRRVERKNSLFNLYEEAICMFALHKTSICSRTSPGSFLTRFWGERNESQKLTNSIRLFLGSPFPVNVMENQRVTAMGKGLGSNPINIPTSFTVVTQNDDVGKLKCSIKGLLFNLCLDFSVMDFD